MKAVWPFLTSVSRSQPPNHVQILFYYEGLGSKTNQHRDNYSTKTLKKACSGLLDHVNLHGNPSPGEENSQIIGPNVVVYTTGNASQLLTLRCPSRHNIMSEREQYISYHENQFECDNSTASILGLVDDLLMTHEATLSTKKGNGY